MGWIYRNRFVTLLTNIKFTNSLHNIFWNWTKYIVCNVQYVHENVSAYKKIKILIERSFQPQLILSNKAACRRDCILEFIQFENMWHLYHPLCFVIMYLVLWTFFTLMMFVERSFYYQMSLNVIWMYYCKQFIKNKDAFYKLSTFVCLHSV